MKGKPRLLAAVFSVAQLGVLVLGVIALTATGAPYEYTFAEDVGRVSVLTQEIPELRFQVSVCGVKPYESGGLLDPDPLFGEPERSKIHVYLDNSDGEMRFDLRRTGVRDSKPLKAASAPRKVFDRDLRLQLMTDGRYCDAQTELTLAIEGARANTAVRWHVEVLYFGDLDSPRGTPPSITVEPVP